LTKKYELVINTAIGGFSLSREAILLGRKISKNSQWGGSVLVGDEQWIDQDYTGSANVVRHDKTLVAVFKQLQGNCSNQPNALALIAIDEPEYTLYIDDTGPETVTVKSKFKFHCIEE
jgi:hypothetical protein